MKEMHSIKINQNYSDKLTILKLIKELGNIPLMEAKDILDDIYMDFNENKTSNIRYTYIDPSNNIEENDNIIMKLKECGVIIGSNMRENNLNELLTKIKVNVLNTNQTYQILEGSFEITQGNIVKLNIISGIIKNDEDNTGIHNSEITNRIITLSLNNCIIEEELFNF